MKPNRDHFKPVPADFHLEVKNTVREAEEKYAAVRPRPRFRRGLAIAAAVLAFVILPTSILGYGIAGKKRRILAEKQKEYVVQPILNVSEDEVLYSPDFVKLSYTVPEGYAKMPHTEEKFSHVENEKKCISVSGLTRPTDGKVQPVSYAVGSRTLDVNGREALIVEYSTATDFNRRAYLYFENVNVYFECYFTFAVSDAELLSLLESVNIVESDASDCTRYTVFDPDAVISTPAGSAANEVRVCRAVLTPMGAEMNVCTGVVGTLDSIQVLDNVSALNRSDFSIPGFELSECIGEDGGLLPRISNEWTWKGEGVQGEDWIPEFVGSKEYGQTFILATLTYTNTTSERVAVAAGPNLVILEENGDGYAYSNTRRGDRSFEETGMSPHYIEGAERLDPETYEARLEGKVKDPRKLFFNVCHLDPGETRTVTVGWRCDTELLENAYLASYQLYTDTTLPLYITKVVSDGN